MFVYDVAGDLKTILFLDSRAPVAHSTVIVVGSLPPHSCTDDNNINTLGVHYAKPDHAHNMLNI